MIFIGLSSGKEESVFFFEKKNQKTFNHFSLCTKSIRVFCFFFSKKKAVA